MQTIKDLTRAYDFSAKKHVKQRRKGVKDIPYINHPIEVANLLCHCGEEQNFELLVASVLHDTIEDTNTSEMEVEQLFGAQVASIVMEVTDDMSLCKKVRRKAQVDEAARLSISAKKIKIADKTCNILDMLTTRFEWTSRMKREYVLWAIEVVNGCVGVNEVLEQEFEKAVAMAKQVLGDLN